MDHVINIRVYRMGGMFIASIPGAKGWSTSSNRAADLAALRLAARFLGIEQDRIDLMEVAPGDFVAREFAA
jgi:hypothetical protein